MDHQNWELVLHSSEPYLAGTLPTAGGKSGFQVLQDLTQGGSARFLIIHAFEHIWQ